MEQQFEVGDTVVLKRKPNLYVDIVEIREFTYGYVMSFLNDYKHVVEMDKETMHEYFRLQTEADIVLYRK